MRLVQNDERARRRLEAEGLAVVPPFSGLLVMDGEVERGAVVVSHFDGEDCEIQCCGSGYWSAGTVREVFRYAFDALKCRRVSARALSDNSRCLAAMKAIGFRQEGVKRRAVDGKDVIMFGMLRDECRVLAGRA